MTIPIYFYPKGFFFSKSKPRITGYRRFLHTFNLSSNSHEPTITEYIVISNGPKFDPSAGLTFAHILVSIFGSMIYFCSNCGKYKTPEHLCQIGCLFCRTGFQLGS